MLSINFILQFSYRDCMQNTKLHKLVVFKKKKY